MLIHPEDKRDPLNTTYVIYTVPCENCPVSYIGETDRKFGKRLDEHCVKVEKLSTSIRIRATRKSSQSVVHKSAISDHVEDNNHLTDWDEARIISKDPDWYSVGSKKQLQSENSGPP